MANIYTIDYIRLNRKGLQTQDENGTWTDLHLNKGRLDGACVVYSTTMALLCLGYIAADDLDDKRDARTPKGKLLNRFFNEQGLIRDGYSLKTMAQEIRSLCDDLVVDRVAKENCIYSIKDYVERGYPVILRLKNEECDFDHAVLAIGTEYEGDENNEKLLKLFCLDPGYDSITPSYWNCVIDTERHNAGEYPFWYITCKQNFKVKIKEFIAIYQE